MSSSDSSMSDDKSSLSDSSEKSREEQDVKKEQDAKKEKRDKKEKKEKKMVNCGSFTAFVPSEENRKDLLGTIKRSDRALKKANKKSLESLKEYHQSNPSYQHVSSLTEEQKQEQRRRFVEKLEKDKNEQARKQELERYSHLHSFSSSFHEKEKEKGSSFLEKGHVVGGSEIFLKGGGAILQKKEKDAQKQKYINSLASNSCSSSSTTKTEKGPVESGQDPERDPKRDFGMDLKREPNAEEKRKRCLEAFEKRLKYEQ